MRRVRRDVVRSGRQDIELAIRFGDLTRSWHGEREEPARFGPPRTPSGGFWWLGHSTPHTCELGNNDGCHMQRALRCALHCRARIHRLFYSAKAHPAAAGRWGLVHHPQADIRSDRWCRTHSLYPSCVPHPTPVDLDRSVT
jgi:hypothetical protein